MTRETLLEAVSIWSCFLSGGTVKWVGSWGGEGVGYHFVWHRERLNDQTERGLAIAESSLTHSRHKPGC